MSNTLKLSLPPTFDFSLVALVSSEPIYRLSYLLNLSLKLDLKEYKSIQIYHPKKQEIEEFLIFRHHKEEPFILVDLIQNRGKNGLLAEEQKKVDYWLKFDANHLIRAKQLEKIKAIKEISLAFSVEPGSLKSKDRFNFSIDE
jgi:hypothetical protein